MQVVQNLQAAGVDQLGLLTDQLQDAKGRAVTVTVPLAARPRRQPPNNRSRRKKKERFLCQCQLAVAVV